jgi:hypothetical protein
MVDSVVTDEILDRLKKTESSGDALALHPKTKALGAYQFMPETAVMLHKKGIEFNPFNEKESRQAAKQYLEMLVKQNNGDLNKALQQYGGFKEQDPTSYINKVTGSKPTQPSAPKDQFDLLGGATEQTQTKNVEKKPSAKLDQFELLTAEPEKTKTQQPVVSKQPEVAQTTAQPIAQPTAEPVSDKAAFGIYPRVSGKRAVIEQAQKPSTEGMGGSLAAIADVVAGAPAYLLGLAGYGGLRAAGRTPEQAAETAYGTAGLISQPIGKLTGTAGTPAYEKDVLTAPLRQLGQYVQTKAKEISKTYGVPEQDVEFAINAGMLAAPKVAKPIAKTVTDVGGAVLEARNQMAQPTGRKLGIGEAETPAQQLQAQFEAKQGKAPTGSVGAAKVNTNPLIGEISGEESVRGTYPQYKVSKIGENVKQPEQSTRASVVNRIYQDVGKENNQIRQGVLTGNEDTLRTEHTKAAMANPTPEGELLKRQIADEQNTLSQFAENRVKNTGADQNLLYPAERGERINDFFAGVAPKGESPSSLPSLFKQEKSKLFQEASDKVGGNPIQTGNVDTLLNDPQFAAGLKLTNTQGVAEGARSLIELAKTVGFKDDMGNFHAANTIDAWAAVRKALNANWTKENAKVIRKINESIDKDIASAGGGDLLKKANDLHKMEKELFGSKGIKDVFGEIDSNGVETGKISFDKLPEKLNSMPPNQWKHIYDVADRMASGRLVSKTLDKEGNPLWVLDVPPEVQRSAQLAKNEMLGSLAREIQAAGAGKSDVWLHDAVNKVLNARADKIAYAFPLEEQQAFRDLNAAGYLMPGKHSYEGGGQQIRRVGMIEGNLGKLGATTGAGLGTAIAGPTGAAIGGYLGQKAGVAGSEALASKALNKEALKAQQQMKKNAELGKHTLNDIKNTK